MLFVDEPLQPVKVPVSSLGTARRRRDLVSRLSGIAALRRAGCMAEPAFVDDRGEPVPEERARVLHDEVAPAIRALAGGRAAHARRTVSELRAARLDDTGQVEELLASVYQAHQRAEPTAQTAGAFLDAFDRWLTPAGVAKVDRLFDRVDLDRVPGSVGVLLLAATRLTRAHFTRREAFLERFAAWLLGRDGRTREDVDAMLQGLRA